MEAFGAGGPAAKEFRVLGTFKLGAAGFRTADNFRRLFAERYTIIGRYANGVLGKIPVLANEVELTLAVASVSDLGLQRGTLWQIYTQAAKFSLGICSPWVGPQLRWDYTDQPVNEYLMVGMVPVDVDGTLELFVVRRSKSGLQLCCCSDGPRCIYVAEDEFIFVKLPIPPRK